MILCFDAFKPPNPRPMLRARPDVPLLFMSFEGLDRRRRDRKPTKPCQVLQCNGFATRDDHIRRGLGAHVAYHCMRQAKEAGFVAMQVETGHPGSDRVFGNPPPPHKAVEVVAFDPQRFEPDAATLGCGLCCVQDVHVLRRRVLQAARAV